MKWSAQRADAAEIKHQPGANEPKAEGGQGGAGDWAQALYGVRAGDGSAPYHPRFLRRLRP